MALKPVEILSDVKISKLAREIARDIKDLADIQKDYGLSPDTFDQVVNDKFFQARLAEEVQLWNASDALSIAKRIEAKAATIVEDCLLEVFTLIHDKQQPMAAKVEALKWAARMAGLGENKAPAGGDGGVKITINVAGKSLEFDKEKKLHGRVIDGTVVDLTPSNA